MAFKQIKLLKDIGELPKQPGLRYQNPGEKGNLMTQN